MSAVCERDTAVIDRPYKIPKWLYQFAFSRLSRFVMGMTARLTPLISNLSATELKSFTWISSLCQRYRARGYSRRRGCDRISSYNGGHIDFFADVVSQLKKKGANDIAVFGGGGGTITHGDARQMKRKGVDKIFFAGTSLTEMTEYVKKHYGKKKKRRMKSKPDLVLARKLTELEEGGRQKSKTPNTDQRTSNI